MSTQARLLAAGDALAAMAFEIAAESRRASGDPSDGDEPERMALAWADARTLHGSVMDRLIGRANTVIAGFEALVSLACSRGLTLSDVPDVERAITEALGAARAFWRETAPRGSLGDRPAPHPAPHQAPRPLQEASLATSLCRCHDAECPDNATCLRWLDRERGAAASPHSWSLRQPQNPWADHDVRADDWEHPQPATAPVPGPCPYYLKVPPPAPGLAAARPAPDDRIPAATRAA